MIHELDKVDPREVYGSCNMTDEWHAENFTMCDCDVDRQCRTHADVYEASGACGCTLEKACLECIDDGVYQRPDTFTRNAAFYEMVARMNGYVDAEQMRYYEFTIH